MSKSSAASKVRVVSPERRDWIKKESEALLAKNLLLREKSKEVVFEKRMQHDRLMEYGRIVRQDKWVKKTKHSPFAVNLVAEDERIFEENRIRMKEEETRRKTVSALKDKAKNELMLKVTKC